MSLRATAAAAVARHAPRTGRSPLREAPVGEQGAGGTAGDVAAQLVRYIPAELVAGYTAVVGVLPVPDGDVCAGDFTARWIALAVFVALTPLTLQVLYLVRWRAANGAGPTIPWFEHGAAAIAFIAWALVLPLTPALTWCSWQPQYGLAVGATVLLVLGLAAQLARPMR
jgi:hypothetical protein